MLIYWGGEFCYMLKHIPLPRELVRYVTIGFSLLSHDVNFT